MDTAAERYVAQGYWRNRTMADEARDLVARAPDHIIVSDDGVSHSAGEIYDLARRLAGALIARGLRPGDRISWQLPNWREAMIIDLAATMAGLIVNPMVPIYREAETGFMMEDIAARLVFVPHLFRGHDYVAMMRRVIPKLSTAPGLVVVRGTADGATSLEDLIAGGDPNIALPEVSPNAVKLIMYTSGTTGRAKGALHTHNTVGAMAQMFSGHIGASIEDRALVSSPVTHITGAILAAQLPWVTGVRAVMMDLWNGTRALELIDEHRITITNGAAPFMADLVRAAQDRDTERGSLRVFIAGGSAISKALGNDAQRIFPNCTFFRCYGATETPIATLGLMDRGAVRYNLQTDGRPFYTDLKIVDPHTGAPVPAGTEGEILMRGAQTMQGYIRAEDNITAFDAEGYFRSGDLGRFVSDDWIEISGRAKDIIIRFGEKLSPREIEDTLRGYAKIRDIAIIARPDKRTGESACAFVVPIAGEHPTLADLAGYLIEQGFAKQKIPEHLVLVDALPMTAAGKVQKHILRERAKALAVADKTA